MATKNEKLTSEKSLQPQPKKQEPKSRLVKGTKKQTPPMLCRPGVYM